MTSIDNGDNKSSPRWWRMPMVWLKRMYDWVLHWAETPYGTPALGTLAFAESSFFPVPPDVLLIALTLGQPRRAWWFGLVCSIGSVLGAALGYYIGFGAWESVKDVFIPYLFSQEAFDKVGAYYHENAWFAIFTAAFTPIPFKVFTIAAGVWNEYVSLGMLMAASVVGRPMRFFLVAGLLYFFGPPVKRFIDKYFDWLALTFVVMLVGGFLLIEKVL